MEDDIIIIELPKKDNTFVFKAAIKQQFKEIEEETKTKQVVVSEFNLTKLKDSEFSSILKEKSRKGVTGLSNLGNTCFMNSGL